LGHHAGTAPAAVHFTNLPFASLHFLDAFFGAAAVVEDGVAAVEVVAAVDEAAPAQRLFFANFPALSWQLPLASSL
jgi:hypothetical protein